MQVINFSEHLNMFEAFHSGSVIHIVAIYSTRRGVNKIPVAICGYIRAGSNFTM